MIVVVAVTALVDVAMVVVVFMMVLVVVFFPLISYIQFNAVMTIDNQITTKTQKRPMPFAPTPQTV